MGVRQPRYSKEEFAQRGQALYEKQVRPQVEEDNLGRIVAIDVETGEFEVADDPIAAPDRLFAGCPDAQPWLVRIGHRALYWFGHFLALLTFASVDLQLLTSMPVRERCMSSLANLNEGVCSGNSTTK